MYYKCLNLQITKMHIKVSCHEVFIQTVSYFMEKNKVPAPNTRHYLINTQVK